MSSSSRRTVKLRKPRKQEEKNPQAHFVKQNPKLSAKHNLIYFHVLKISGIKNNAQKPQIANCNHNGNAKWHSTCLHTLILLSCQRKVLSSNKVLIKNCSSVTPLKNSCQNSRILKNLLAMGQKFLNDFSVTKNTTSLYFKGFINVEPLKK